MRIYVDTEFIDTGKEVILLSLGAVRHDNKLFYAEVEGADTSKAVPWVQQNVLPKLGKAPNLIKSRKQIAHDFAYYCGEEPEFWGYYASYDWVLICQLYGRMIDVPHTWPMYINDVASLAHHLGRPDHNLMADQPEPGHHHAMHDAMWTRTVHTLLMP